MRQLKFSGLMQPQMKKLCVTDVLNLSCFITLVSPQFAKIVEFCLNITDITPKKVLILPKKSPQMEGYSCKEVIIVISDLIPLD